MTAEQSRIDTMLVERAATMLGVEEAKVVPLALALGVVLVSALLLLALGGGGRKRAARPFLTKARVKVPLVEKEILSPTVRRFRFGLPAKDMCLGLPVGKHIKVFGPNREGVTAGSWNGRDETEKGVEIERKYTPTSSDKNLGYFELVLKVYKGGVEERFPDGGKLSKHLDGLQVGDEVDIQGPFGLYTYEGRGLFTLRRKEFTARKVGMIAGGTGITPMLQVIDTVLSDPADTTQLWLLFANQTEEDIFLREKLEALQKAHPEQFRLHYTLDRPPADWAYSKGFIDEAMVREHLPAPADDTLVLMCGPPPMIKFACRPNLDKVGHAAANQIDF